MNIFILDRNPQQAASYHCDVHVVSQLKEAAQIMSTACHLMGVWAKGMNRPTHAAHPCVVWATKSLENLEWLNDLAFHLNNEFRLRREARGVVAVDHKSVDVTTFCWATAVARRNRQKVPGRAMTAFAQAMPDRYRQDDPVAAYRAYYQGEKHLLRDSKGRMVEPQWTMRGPPSWWCPLDGFDLIEPEWEDL